MDCIPFVYATPVQTAVGPRAVLGIATQCAIKKNLTISFGFNLSDEHKGVYAYSNYIPLNLGPSKLKVGLVESSTIQKDGIYSIKYNY